VARMGVRGKGRQSLVPASSHRIPERDQRSESHLLLSGSPVLLALSETTAAHWPPLIAVFVADELT